MVGHYYKSIDAELISLARSLKCGNKSLAGSVICKVGEPVVAGEGYKVRLAAVVKAREPAWHEDQFSDKKASA
jgi:hypothetical protein